MNNYFDNDIKFSNNTLNIISNKLLKKFDKNNSGYLENNEILNLMQDSYSSKNVDMNLNKNDINLFIKLYDLDNDGKIGINDIKNYMFKILGSNFDNETLDIYQRDTTPIISPMPDMKTIKKKHYLTKPEIKDIIKKSVNSLNMTSNLESEIDLNDNIIDEFIKIVSNNSGNITKDDLDNFINKNLNLSNKI